MASPLVVERIDGFGLPLFWVVAEGPTVLGLSFRAGRQLEPMALRGVSRLIEHIVAAEVGFTLGSPKSADVTSFVTRGTPETVAQYLFAVSSTLTSLPLARVDAARDAVRREDHERRIGVRERLLQLRHGYLGPGAGALGDWGANKLGHGQALGWATSHFHKGNSVLWGSGPLPTDLPLRLVSGPPLFSDVRTQGAPTPGAAVGAPGLIGVSLTGVRSAAFKAALEITAARIRKELCDVQRVSTAVQLQFEDINAFFSEALIVANAAPGKDDAVAAVILATLEAMATNGATADELSSYVGHLTAVANDTKSAPVLARDAAYGHLTARKGSGAINAMSAALAVTPAETAALMTEALSSVLAIAPANAQSVHSRLANVDHWSFQPQSGTPVRPVKGLDEKKANRELIIGPRGMSLRDGSVQASLKFSDCGLLLIHVATGDRELFAHDGTHIYLSSGRWELTDSLREHIDNQVAAANRVVLDPERVHAAAVERRMRQRS